MSEYVDKEDFSEFEQRAIFFHEQGINRKIHMWDCHQERDIDPAGLVQFRGGIENHAIWPMPFQPLLSALGVLYEGGKKLREFTSPTEAAVTVILESLFNDTAVMAEDAIEMRRALPPRDYLPTNWPERGDKLHFTVFIGEMYIQPLDPGEHVAPEDKIEAPGLEHDFKNNPDTKVVETLCTVYTEDNLVGGAKWVVVVQPYHMDDGGRFVFDNAEVTCSEDPRLEDELRDHYSHLPALKAVLPFYQREVQ